MAATPALDEVAEELARLSIAIVDALGAADLDRAETLVAERGRLLDEMGDGARPVTDPRAIARARATIVDADRQSEAALRAAIDRARAELAALAHGARAMQAYLDAPPLTPGWVDRRD
jgi:hypothetical protein